MQQIFHQFQEMDSKKLEAIMGEVGVTKQQALEHGMKSSGRAMLDGRTELGLKEGEVENLTKGLRPQEYMYDEEYQLFATELKRSIQEKGTMELELNKKASVVLAMASEMQKGADTYDVSVASNIVKESLETQKKKGGRNITQLNLVKKIDKVLNPPEPLTKTQQFKQTVSRAVRNMKTGFKKRMKAGMKKVMDQGKKIMGRANTGKKGQRSR